MSGYAAPIECPDHETFDVLCGDCRFLTVTDREPAEQGAAERLQRVRAALKANERGLATNVETVDLILEATTT
jgi:hypothetical protein